MPKSGRAAALVRAGALMGVGALVLAVVGCTPEEPGGGSSPGPASPTPAASATESAEDRAERERGEHAIEVYERADAELYNLLQQGANGPSAEFGKYAAGSYYDAARDLLKQVSADGAKAKGDVERIKIWVQGSASDTKVSLVSCEDSTGSYYVDKDGDRMPNDEPLLIQRGEVEPVDGGTWKVTYVESTRLASFEGTECSDAG